MRLDVTLVGLLGLVAFLDDHVGFGETGVDVTVSKLGHPAYVGRLGRPRIHPRRAHVGLHDRCAGFHRFVDVRDVG